ncbi:MAG TPA: hypothetical protein VHW24_22110, partial [Bryobacteraceae bacterium]|nr:hypothetical protein [Bryobacteraceae bacterium]
QQVREREYPVIDPATGVSSFIHIEDAAAATVSALQIRPGVYNIVDEDPVTTAVWLPAFAASLSAPAPPHVSEQQAIQAGGPDAVYYATQLRALRTRKRKGVRICATAPGVASRESIGVMANYRTPGGVLPPAAAALEPLSG